MFTYIREQWKKIIFRYFIYGILATIVIGLLVSLSVPSFNTFVYRFYDTHITHKVPNPYLTFTISTLIENNNPIDYTNFTSLINFLVEGLQHGIFPGNEFLTYTVRDPAGKTYCSIAIPIVTSSDLVDKLEFYQYEDIPKPSSCPFCRFGAIHFKNFGSGPPSYVKSKICLGEHLSINLIDSKNLEQRDGRCFVFSVHDLFENDSIYTPMVISKPFGGLISPSSTLSEFSAFYDWRGKEESIEKSKLSVLYRIYIENCVVERQTLLFHSVDGKWVIEKNGPNFSCTFS